MLSNDFMLNLIRYFVKLDKNLFRVYNLYERNGLNEKTDKRT